MEKIDFTPIGEAMKAFDTDLIDIGRREIVKNPDGTIGETNPEEPLYTNVPCHLSFDTIDNPDENTVDSEPIITMITINCELSVDLQKGDYITAYKMDVCDNILETYVGIIGFPEVNMSRKSAKMQMKTGV